MITPVMPQNSYRERSSRLKQIDEDKNALIDVGFSQTHKSHANQPTGTHLEAGIE